MKRKNLVFILAVIITALVALALCSCGGKKLGSRFGDFWYTVADKKVTITGYVGSEAHLTVPESIKDMPVVAIGKDAFADTSTLKTVTIPDSVERIDFFAFDKCINLEKVTLGNGIKEIDCSPFYRCDKMQYNEYENGCYIGNDENPYMALVCMANDYVEHVKIHPDTVVICGSAMDKCRLVREIEIPEGVVYIGSYAMRYCSALEKVYIPASVEFIDLLIFWHCDNLREVIVADGNMSYKAVDGHLFSYDGSRLIKYAPAQEADSYRVPEGTVIIEDNAFENAKNLTEVILPDSLETIGHSAFAYCENIKTISFGNGVKTIDGDAFNSCESLAEVTLPDSVEIVSYYAFKYCKGLRKVVIGSGVVSVEKGAFWGCTALKEIVFKDTSKWSMRGMYWLFSKKIDVSDPAKNAENLTGEYCELYFNKN
jgi:hypothetical protein